MPEFFMPPSKRRRALKLLSDDEFQQARQATSAALKAAEAPRPEAAGRAARGAAAPVRRGKKIRCLYEVPSYASVADVRRALEPLLTASLGAEAAADIMKWERWEACVVQRTWFRMRGDGTGSTGRGRRATPCADATSYLTHREYRTRTRRKARTTNAWRRSWQRPFTIPCHITCRSTRTLLACKDPQEPVGEFLRFYDHDVLLCPCSQRRGVTSISCSSSPTSWVERWSS